MNTTEKYNELMKQYEDLSVLNSIGSVLFYDLETKTLAPSGVDHRGKQMALLAGITHKRMNDKNYTSLIDSLHNSNDLDNIQKRNVELLYRSQLTATSVPASLVSKLAEQANKTNKAWKAAKKIADYKLVEKEVSSLFDVTVERAQIIADVKGFKNPQSALLSERDPGFNVDNLTKIFSETKSYLLPMIEKIKSKQEDIDRSFLKNDYPRDLKVTISETIADLYQFDYKSENAVGRIGEVEHPLTIACGPKDVRVTVNYTNYSSMISATQHELGHGLHRLNNNPAWLHSPISNSVSPSVAEMTSRYTENKIGKEMAFWDTYYPTLQKLTGLTVDKETFYNAFTYVEPGYKRMSADEVSYGLHIIIRFEIEKALFDQKIDFSEVTQLWSEKYREYLGIEVEDDTKGVLQDLHWYTYYWAYFQGYALGDLIGSQVHYHMVKTNPTWKDDMAKGDLSTVNQYFIDNIYSKGALYDPLDFVQEITGSPFDTKYLKKYLAEKYLQ